MFNFEIPKHATELKAKANGLKEEAEKLTRAALKLVKEAAPVLPIERYAVLAQELRNMLKANTHGEPVQEFIRRAVTYTGSGIPKHPANYCESVAFFNEYSSICNKLHRSLESIDLGRSDDSFSDLLDVLPLAPKNLIDELLAPHIHEGVFEHWESKNRVELADLLHTEAYVDMLLTKALETFLPCDALENV